MHYGIEIAGLATGAFVDQGGARVIDRIRADVHDVRALFACEGRAEMLRHPEIPDQRGGVPALVGVKAAVMTRASSGWRIPINWSVADGSIKSISARPTRRQLI